MIIRNFFALLLAAFAASSSAARAEDGSAAWLRYAPLRNAAAYSNLPSHIAVLGDSPIDHSAGEELKRGLSSMLGRKFDVQFGTLQEPNGNSIVIASTPTLSHMFILGGQDASPQGEAYRIAWKHEAKGTTYALLGGSPQAELYAVFHLLETIAAERPIPTDERQSPAVAIRWTDEWDNMNGSIERGYAGRSIFFDNGHVRQDLSRVSAYGRLLASIGLNGCNINNVNADLDVLSTEHLHELARIADALRPWGVRMALSIDMTSPKEVGKLDTFDPLDPKVAAWWKTKVDEMYTIIPDLAGFTVKADSEGRAGPATYHRTPADAANVLARALAPHHGVVLYRGFVYNNHLDFNDRKADRARAGVDNFIYLDGKFEPNVIIQIKHGPIDFQAVEPVSPLFSALHHTDVAIEFQASQEYTGQQRHMTWLVPMWKSLLSTDMRVEGQHAPLADIVEGKTFHRPMGGFIAVSNVGLEPNWMYHPMAIANLYGYGKLAWNPDESAGNIIDTWTRLTWGNDPEVVRTITSMQLASWQNYVHYTGPNGQQTLTDILGVHFGPGIESAENNGWGQWFRGEKNGVGMDRTVATGTGYAGQYPPELAAKYENLATCPDDLILFFHHVPYDYKLHSGKTLTQSVYDDHYAGALAAGEYVGQWDKLKGKVDPERFAQVHELFTFQAGHAIVWRDAIDRWYHEMSGIEDAQHRVGHDPNRVLAVDMKAQGYTPEQVDVGWTGFPTQAVVCKGPEPCTLTTKFDKPAGSYNLAVQYFDLHPGTARYQLLINNREAAAWAADAVLPPAMQRPKLDGQTATRYTAHNLTLKPGDTVTLRGFPDLHPDVTIHNRELINGTRAEADPNANAPAPAQELAPVDYIEFGPAGPLTPQ